MIIPPEDIRENDIFTYNTDTCDNKCHLLLLCLGVVRYLDGVGFIYAIQLPPYHYALPEKVSILGFSPTLRPIINKIGTLGIN